MGYLTILSGLLKLINVFAQKAKDKQLLDAGEAKAIVRMSNEGMGKIYKAKLARDNVKHDVDSLRNDPNNRNRR